MQHLETDTGHFVPHWGEKEQTVSTPVPLMTGSEVSRIPRIPASAGNPTSHVQADGTGNMSVVLSDWKPWSGLGLGNRGPVPEILVG